MHKHKQHRFAICSWMDWLFYASSFSILYKSPCD